MVAKKIEPVARARLLEMLAEAPRLTMIRAPAGFGKSMLLDQFEARLAQAGRVVVRLNLSQEPAEAGRLALGKDAVLLVDDADRLPTVPAAAKLLERLASSSGRSRIVLASRGAPGLPLARHRATGDVLDIGPRELLFDAGEQQAALSGGAAHSLPASRIKEIAATLAGWPCGYGLQSRCWAEGAPLTGSWRIVADYFEQEVMAGLPDGLRRFLARASVLEQLTVEDCGALLGDTGGLDQAHERGAPLWPVDPEHRGYAILPLFRQFLRTRLDDGDAARLGAQAVTLLEKRGRFRDASVQALAIGDHELAARLLELQLKADFAFRDDGELVVLAERIDARARERHPFILLALAQALTFRFEFEKARRQLELASTLAPQVDAADSRTVEMLLLHREMILALGQHELSRAQEHGDRLLQDLQDVPPMQRVMILNSLTYAQQELYIFRGAERYYVQAKNLIPELDSWISSIPLETFYARHLFQTGRTSAAIELLEATLARLTAELGPKPVLGSIAAIVLAEIKFETNQLDEAAQLLADYGGNVEQFGFLPMTLAARTVQARLHMARGEHDLGFAVLDRPLAGARGLFDKMSRALAVERIYWLFKLGRVDAARLACGEIGLSLARPPEPHSSAAAAEEAYATAWIELARASKRIDEAIRVAQKWQRYTEGVGAVRSNVRWNVLLAALRVLAQEPGFAMRHLRRAALLGAGGLYRGAFLAEADLLGGHVAQLVDSDLSELERAFLQSVTGDSGVVAGGTDPPDIAVPLGAFSAREAAILRLVAKGKLNREIGSTLGMTEGTVKWYLQGIYDKLGVRRRAQVAILVAQWNARAAREGEALH